VGVGVTGTSLLEVIASSPYSFLNCCGSERAG
jgi:hypothetical protein